MRTITGWQICIDYCKLNATIKKNHFLLPFIDQILDMLLRKKFYYFLDDYSGYNQITITRKDQHKTTFTCSYGTFAICCIPFGLCNALGIFQRYMMAIFSGFLERSIEIFMDHNFSIFGNFFKEYLGSLEDVLKRCKET